jgi:hypothetical protein
MKLEFLAQAGEKGKKKNPNGFSAVMLESISHIYSSDRLSSISPFPELIFRNLFFENFQRHAWYTIMVMKVDRHQTI